MRRIWVDEARGLFEGLDGRGYGAYRELRGVIFRGECRWGRVELRFTRVQGDPYAPPSVLEARARLPKGLEGLEPTPLADYAHRLLAKLLAGRSRRRGSGNSGRLGLPRVSNAMLRRSGFEVVDGHLVARVWFGLPASGRRIRGLDAYEMLVDALHGVCETLERMLGGEKNRVAKHVETYRLQEELRAALRGKRLVAFIGEGAILPRRCAWCEEPLEDAEPFHPPPGGVVELETSRGVVRGMGIPRGFTVLTGHPFHGKTTLLEAIAHGVYNHVPGDGRELVVSLRGLYWVEAEDGRPVHGRDISPLIHGLPRGDPTRFTTSDASGATSMAASIIEALEAGAELLLVDEDRAATNLLHVDERVVEMTGEPPVTPLRVYAHCLSKQGVSTILVTGALGPLIDEAENLIVMKNFEPVYYEAGRHAPKPGVCKWPRAGRVATRPWEARAEPPWLRGRRDGYKLSLASNRVLVEDGQYNTIALLLRRAWEGDPRAVAKTVEELLSRGFEALTRSPPPDLSEIRGLDFIHAVHRLPPGAWRA